MQWHSDSFKVHQIRFRPGHRPGPHWGSVQRSPDLLAGLRGTNSKEEGVGRKVKERGRGAQRKVKHPPPRKFLDPQLVPIRSASSNQRNVLSVKLPTYIRSSCYGCSGPAVWNSLLEYVKRRIRAFC